MGKKKKKVTVVLDTNVLISAILFRKHISEIANLWKTRVIVPVFSKDTFEEFVRVLRYPKFSLTEEEINTIVYEEVLPYFEVIVDEEKIEGVCIDPEDDKFISCALSSWARFIVSGDPDLFGLKKYETIRILKPSEFLKLFEKGRATGA